MNNSKLKIFIIIALLILLLILGHVLYITKEKSQTQIALSGEEFKAKMQGYGYYVSGPYNDEGGTNYTAYNKSSSIKIEFYKYLDEDAAKKDFNTSKSIWKINKSAELVEINKAFKYEVTMSNNDYWIHSIVGDTSVLVSTDLQNKETVTEILNNLGY